MLFTLTDESRMVRETVRSILKQSPGQDQAQRELRSCAALLHELSEAGFQGLLVPAQYGGSDLSLVEAAIFAEELGASAAPVPFLGSVVLAPIALREAGSPMRDILADLANGKALVGVGLASDGNTVDHSVVAGSGKLSGMVRHAIETNGVSALLITDQNGSVHLVRADAPGLDIRPERSLDAGRTMATLHLHHAEAICLGDSELRDRLVAAARTVLAADTLGACTFMLQRAVAFSLERKQFGRPIGSFQAVKHMCAEMAAAIEASRALVTYAAWSFEHEPAQSRLQAILAKSHLDDVGSFIARRAIEVHGAIGLTDDVGLHYWWKRIAFNRTVLGNPDMLRHEAARMQSL